MDFLDPNKHRAHTRRLIIGYVLIGLAILLAVTVLLYLTYGFTLKQGKVIQNGLLFVSSAPSGAKIYLNDKSEGKTGTHMTLEAGSYVLRLSRDGYRDWQRAVTVEGGSIEHIDYPFLVPKNLITTNVAAYSSAPALISQSPDRRWLLVWRPSSLAALDIYDLKDPKKIASSVRHASLPADLLAKATGAQSLEFVEWADDNIHALVRHTYNKTAEYLLVNRKDLSQSVNLTKALGLKPTMKPSLRSKKFDQYFVYDAAAKSLSVQTLNKPGRETLLTNVLDYKSYGDNEVLYATPGADKAHTAIKILDNGHSHTLRSVAASKKYLLELSRYGNAWYAVAGAPSEGRVYVYKNPASTLRDQPNKPLVPMSVLKVADANHVSFSANSQYVAVENGKNFAIYDIEYDKSFAYTADDAPDKPQAFATWMDGNRLQFVSGGKVVIFDYDGTNRQALSVESANFLPYFDSSYRYLYTIAQTPKVSSNATNGQTPPKKSATFELTSTSMRTPADQ